MFSIELNQQLNGEFEGEIFTLPRTMNLKICAMLVVALAIVGTALSENVPSDDAVKKLIDDLDEEQSLEVFGGLSIEKIENSDEVSPRSEGLTDRIIRYVQSHRVNFDLSEERSDVGGKIKPLHIIKKKVKSTSNKATFIYHILFTSNLSNQNYEANRLNLTSKCVTQRQFNSIITRISYRLPYRYSFAF